MATHSNMLAWKIPRMEPGRLQSTGSLRVRHDWATSLSLFTFMHWRRKWQPTPVFLPEESRDGGAWWAATSGVAQSRTRLKWLSSSSRVGSQNHVSPCPCPTSWATCDSEISKNAVTSREKVREGRQDGKFILLMWGKQILYLSKALRSNDPIYLSQFSMLVAQLYPTLCDPMDYTPPGSSVHGIIQARILEWVAILFSRESSQLRDQTLVSCIAGRFFTIWATREDPVYL